MTKFSQPAQFATAKLWRGMAHIFLFISMFILALSEYFFCRSIRITHGGKFAQMFHEELCAVVYTLARLVRAKGIPND